MSAWRSSMVSSSAFAGCAGWVAMGGSGQRAAISCWRRMSWVSWSRAARSACAGSGGGVPRRASCLRTARGSNSRAEGSERDVVLVVVPEEQLLEGADDFTLAIEGGSGAGRSGGDLEGPSGGGEGGEDVLDLVGVKGGERLLEGREGFDVGGLGQTV